MRNMLLTTALVLTTAFNVIWPVRGEEITAEQLKTRTLGWAIKGVLKAYLQNSDFFLLKHQKITELKKMNAQAFSDQYAGAWSVLKKCPALVARQRLAQNTTKDQLLKIMTCLSLRDCLEAVDSVPDEVMIEQFEQCVNNPETEDKPLKEQIGVLLDKWLPKT